MCVCVELATDTAVGQGRLTERKKWPRAGNKKAAASVAGGSGSKTSTGRAQESSMAVNEFGSPAAVAAPQVATTTLVFSATKMITDLTGTSVMAARSPKLRTPPKSATKTKGLLKTPNSVNKRRSVCFVDHRNETAYLASNSKNGEEWIPGIVRVKTPQPKFDDKSPDKGTEEGAPGPVQAKSTSKGKAKSAPSPGKRVEGGKRTERDSMSPSTQNPRGSKRRRIEASTYAGVTISHKVSKDGNSASYVQLENDAPGVEDIEAFFLDAANRMFADLLAGTAGTPGKYYAGAKGVAGAYPAGNFPKLASMEADAVLQEATKVLTGNATPSKSDEQVVTATMNEAAEFLFKSPKPDADQAMVITACLENAAAALTDSATKLRGKQVAKGAKQMFTSTSKPKQPWMELMQSMHASMTPKAKPKGRKSDVDAANELWQATAPSTQSKVVKGRRSSVPTAVSAPGLLKGSRRSSTGSLRAKSPARPAEEDEEEEEEDVTGIIDSVVKSIMSTRPTRTSGAAFDAAAVFSEVAPKTAQKSRRRSSSIGRAASEVGTPLTSQTPKSRRSSTGSLKSKSPAEPAEEEEEEEDVTGIVDSIVKSIMSTRPARTSGAAFDAGSVFADIAPKTAEKRRRASSVGAVESRRASAASDATKASTPKAKTPAKPAPKTSEKKPAVELKAKTPLPMPAAQKKMSYRSAVKKGMPAPPPEVEFDAAEVYAQVAPKTAAKQAGSGAKPPRRSSLGVLAQKLEAEMDVEESPATGKRKRSMSPAKAKGPSPSKAASPKADEVDFDANQVYAEVAPKTPTRGRWSLTNMVTSVVSSVVSVGRRLSGTAVSVPERKSMSPPPVKPAPVAEPEAAEETVPTEVEIKKPARRGRKSVIPELPKETEPVAPQEIVEEAALAPPPRRGRKSVVPAVVEEQAKKEKASRKRKSVMHDPVVEEVEVEVPRARRAKKAPSPGGTAPKSPHVTIGETDKTHFITPRQKNDWRTGADTEDEEVVVEEAPKKKAKKTAAAKPKPAAKEETVEADSTTAFDAMSRSELVALCKERGLKANGKTVDLIKSLQEQETVAESSPAKEEPKLKAPANASAPKRGKATVERPELELVVEAQVAVEEPKKATRGRKSVATALVEVVEEAPKKSTRGRKSVAPAVVEEPVVEEVPARASRGRKSVAPAVEIVEEPVAPAPKTKRGAKKTPEAVVVEEKKAPVRAGRASGAKRSVSNTEPEPQVQEKKTKTTRAAKKTAEKVEAPVERRSTRRA